MLFLLSPAKKLDLSGAASVMNSPILGTEADYLAGLCKKFSKAELMKLSGTSETIAAENLERWKKFHSNPAKAASLAFDGPAYRGLDAGKFNNAEKKYAHKNIRILSGLYGLLKAFDGIKPYRLEMGTKIKNKRGDNLYDYWGDLIAKELLKEGGGSSAVIVNCASQEYAKSVLPYLKSATVITCEFPGPAVYAKKARGMVCRYAAQKNCTKPEELKQFTGWAQDRYKFDAKASTKDKFVFNRTSGAVESNKHYKRASKRISQEIRESISPSPERDGRRGSTAALKELMLERRTSVSISPKRGRRDSVVALSKVGRPTLKRASLAETTAALKKPRTSIIGRASVIKRSGSTASAGGKSPKSPKKARKSLLERTRSLLAKASEKKVKKQGSKTLEKQGSKTLKKQGSKTLKKQGSKTLKKQGSKTLKKQG